jgi:hypothetical protein
LGGGRLKTEKGREVEELQAAQASAREAWRDAEVGRSLDSVVSMLTYALACVRRLQSI